MNSVPNLNAIPDTSPAKLAIAKAHAVACFNALEKHCKANAMRSGFPICGCFVQPYQGHFVTHKSCDVGQSLGEEYEIASRRVREIQAAQALEAGDFVTEAEPVFQGRDGVMYDR